MRWSELSPALSVREYVFLNVADLDQNYVSTMRTPSVRDLEWHKGKKTRHRRRLSLLHQVLVSSQSHSSAESCERLSQQGVLCRFVHWCRAMAAADEVSNSFVPRPN
jgi:hypothetical protein